MAVKMYDIIYEQFISVLAEVAHGGDFFLFQLLYSCMA